MHDVACEFRAQKDAQKQLARTSLRTFTNALQGISLRRQILFTDTLYIFHPYKQTTGSLKFLTVNCRKKVMLAQV